MSTENSVLSLKVLGLSPLPSAGVFLTFMLSHDRGQSSHREKLYSSGQAKSPRPLLVPG